MISNKAIDKKLNKLRQKIWVNRIINKINYGLFLISILFLSMSIIALFSPILHYTRNIIYTAFILFILSIIYGLIKRPNSIETARIGDALGLEDRLITYLEFKHNNESIVDIFIEDLDYLLKNKELNKLYKIKINKKLLFLSLVILLFSFGLSFLPSNSKELAKAKEEINNNIKKEIKIIDEIKEETLKEENKINQKEMQGLLKELENKLNKTYDYKTAAGEISKTQNEILQRIDDNKNKLENTISGIFEGTSLNNDVRDKNSKDITSKNNNISDSKLLKPEDKKAVKDNLSKELNKKHDKTTEKLLKELKNDLENNELNIDKIQNKINKAYKENKSETDENIINRLEETKKNILAKNDEEGLKGVEGSDKIDAFSSGDSSNFGNGENSLQSSEDNFSGGAGNTEDSTAKGIGGSGSKASGESNGSAKYEISERIISTKKTDKVIELEGETKDLEKTDIKFEDKIMQYIINNDISVDRKELIINYFKSISL